MAGKLTNIFTHENDVLAPLIKAIDEKNFTVAGMALEDLAALYKDKEIFNRIAHDVIYFLGQKDLATAVKTAKRIDNLENSQGNEDITENRMRLLLAMRKQFSYPKL